jgi:hypothetical protein
LYLPRAIMLALGEGLQRIFWYEFRDGGTDPTYNEHRFGIIHLDLSPKPAYYSYQALMRALGDADSVGKLDVGEGNYCYVFDAGDTKTAAVWRPEGTATLTLQVSGDGIMLRDHHGDEIAPDMRGDTLELTVGPKARYVTGLQAVSVP